MGTPPRPPPTTMASKLHIVRSIAQSYLAWLGCRHLQTRTAHAEKKEHQRALAALRAEDSAYSSSEEGATSEDEHRQGEACLVSNMGTQGNWTANSSESTPRDDCCRGEWDAGPSTVEDAGSDSMDSSNCEATGWLFILFNVCDEVKTIMNRGGWDEHLHHCGCIVSASVNMAIMRSTKNIALKGAMVDTFHTLLANEAIAPFFNAYAFLTAFNRNRGMAGFVLLASLLPVLLFRSKNSFTLIRRLVGDDGEELNSSCGAVVFKYASIALCVALMVLDVQWTRWALTNMRKII